MQRVLGVTLFKAGYFERRTCLKSTQLKQNQNEVNSSKFVKKLYMYDQFYLNELVLWFCFLMLMT